MKEVIIGTISILNNNPFIITIIGWLLVFLLAFQTQRIILGTNLRWKLFSEILDNKKRCDNYMSFNSTEKQIQHFQTDFVLFIQKNHTIGLNKDDIKKNWINYIKEKETYINNTLVHIKKLRGKASEVLYVNPEASKLFLKFEKLTSEFEIKLFQYVNFLEETKIQELLINQDNLKIINQRNQDVDSLIANTLGEINEFLRSLSKVFFGSMFGFISKGVNNNSTTLEVNLVLEDDGTTSFKNIHIKS